MGTKPSIPLDFEFYDHTHSHVSYCLFYNSKREKCNKQLENKQEGRVSNFTISNIFNIKIKLSKHNVLYIDNCLDYLFIFKQFSFNQYNYKKSNASDC